MDYFNYFSVCSQLHFNIGKSFGEFHYSICRIFSKFAF